MDNYNLEVGKRIKESRKHMNYTLQELGALVNLSGATIQRYEAGKLKGVDINLLKQLSNVLNVSIAYLMGWKTKEEEPAIRINVYGTVPAGIPIEDIEDIRDWEEIPREWTRGRKEYIALVVQGDSMYPKYIDGDIVIVELQTDCESGDDCVVFVNGSNAMIRRVLKNSEDSIILEPFNRIYAPTKLSNSKESISILGIVKELRRKI